MAPNMEVTLDKWQKWVSALIEGDNSIVAKLNQAANDLERNIQLQNEGKWGTEEGPRPSPASTSPTWNKKSRRCARWQ